MSRYIQEYAKKSSGLFVEAARVSEDSVEEIASWTGGQIVEERDAITHQAIEGLNITTPEGRKRASWGAYVFKIGDEFFVAPGGQFEALYSRVPEVEIARDPFNGKRI